tara:strand:- start:50242 stop:50427 length:186 start_codon:yes stop_codon:yes gene_type:complete
MGALMQRSLALLIVLGLGLYAGCGGHGGVVQESDEMTFDQMAEMAAQETDSRDQSAESASQ